VVSDVVPVAGAVAAHAAGARVALAAVCLGAGFGALHEEHAAMRDASKTTEAVLFPMPRRRPG
jgi:hypothetical protein